MKGYLGGKIAPIKPKYLQLDLELINSDHKKKDRQKERASFSSLGLCVHRMTFLKLR